MSKRAEEYANAQYPQRWVNKTPTSSEKVDYNEHARWAARIAYEQAEKDTIERACQLLYDYNKQMTEIFGAKAVLSCNQFTIDVERFRKTLIIEEE